MREISDFDVEMLEYVFDVLIAAEKLPSAPHAHRLGRRGERWISLSALLRGEQRRRIRGAGLARTAKFAVAFRRCVAALLATAAAFGARGSITPIVDTSDGSIEGITQNGVETFKVICHDQLAEQLLSHCPRARADVTISERLPTVVFRST